MRQCLIVSGRNIGKTKALEEAGTGPHCGDCGLALVAIRGAKAKFLFWKCPMHGKAG